MYRAATSRTDARAEPTRGCAHVRSARTSVPAASTLSRRTFLRAAGVTGAAALSPAVIRKAAEAQETPSPIRPDPAAKRGGTLRYGILSAPAHFDVHQSGTVANIGAQSPMYDCLIRRDPRDGQTIIPDLAWKWDIAPDGKKYTFYLRKGVKFHDGADFTAEDVRATYERIVRPPKGVVIPRSSLFTTVGDIVILDPHRIEFRMTEPRPKAFMLGCLRERLEHHRAQEEPGRQSGQSPPGDELPWHRAFQARVAPGQGSLDHGAERQLLEQGPAVRGQARGLSPGAVLSRAGVLVPGGQDRLRAGSSIPCPGARPRRCRT